MTTHTTGNGTNAEQADVPDTSGGRGASGGVTCPAYPGLLEPGARVIVASTEGESTDCAGRRLTVGQHGIVTDVTSKYAVIVGHIDDDLGPAWSELPLSGVRLLLHDGDTVLPREVDRLACFVLDQADVAGVSVGVELWDGKHGLTLCAGSSILSFTEPGAGPTPWGDETITVPGITAIPDAVGRLVRAAEVVCG